MGRTPWRSGRSSRYRSSTRPGSRTRRRSTRTAREMWSTRKRTRISRDKDYYKHYNLLILCFSSTFYDKPQTYTLITVKNFLNYLEYEDEFLVFILCLFSSPRFAIKRVTFS